MSYNNNGYNSNYGGRSSYGSGGYSRSSYSRGGGYGSGQRRQAKKHSGCKAGYSHGQQDAPYIRGWNYNRRNGMTSIIAGPYKKTSQHTSKSGIVWENWCAKVQCGRNQPYLVSCLYNTQSRKVIIKQMGLVMNPAKDYCGTFTKSRN